MTNDPNRSRIREGRAWLAGLGLLLLGFFTLLLVLQWLRTFETLAIAAGLTAMAGMFVLFGWVVPSQNVWSGWAGYLILNIAAVIGIGELLNFNPGHYVAFGLFQLGMPFLVLYVRQVWLRRRPEFWWALIPAGALITFAGSILQVRVGWPEQMLLGIEVITFMGGITGTLLLLWYPNRNAENFTWLIYPTIITGLLTLFGLLLTIQMPALAIPFVLFIFAGYFLLRFLVAQYRRPEEETEAAAEPPSRPQIPITTERPPQPSIAPPAPPVQLPGTTLSGQAPPAPPGLLTLHSDAITPRGFILPRHTRDGGNRSPRLTWSTVPSGTQSFALICDNPDMPQGIWVHWLLYNIPADMRTLPPGVPAGDYTMRGAMHGLNDFNNPGYDGPAPPPGQQHRHYFKLYALDCVLPLPPRARKRDLVRAMDGHILATGQLVGTFRQG